MSIPLEEIRIEVVWVNGWKETAVKITHLPTGLVARCKSFKSEKANRQHALIMLEALLAEEDKKNNR